MYPCRDRRPRRSATQGKYATGNRPPRSARRKLPQTSKTGKADLQPAGFSYRDEPRKTEKVPQRQVLIGSLVFPCRDRRPRRSATQGKYATGDRPPSKLGINPHRKRCDEKVTGGLKASIHETVYQTEKHPNSMLGCFSVW